MVNNPSHQVGAHSEGRTSPITTSGQLPPNGEAPIYGPTRADVLAFLHGTGPLEGQWFNDVCKAPRYWWRRHLAVLEAPIPMVLHCPACGTQHIDEPTEHWPNPPHRSHLCGSCGCIWRPADVPTVGVEAVTTHSACDTWPLIKEMSERDDELAPLASPCKNAPWGWRCTLGAGHDGNCEAVPWRSGPPMRDEGDLPDSVPVEMTNYEPPPGAVVVAPLLGGLVERQAVIDVLGHHPHCCDIVRRVPYAQG